MAVLSCALQFAEHPETANIGRRRASGRALNADIDQPVFGAAATDKRSSYRSFKQRTTAVIASGAVALNPFFRSAPVRLRGRGFGARRDGGAISHSITSSRDELRKLPLAVRNWLPGALMELLRNITRAQGLPAPNVHLERQTLYQFISRFYNKLFVNTADGDSFTIDDCLPAVGWPAALSVAALKAASADFTKVPVIVYVQYAPPPPSL